MLRSAKEPKDEDIGAQEESISEEMVIAGLSTSQLLYNQN